MVRLQKGEFTLSTANDVVMWQLSRRVNAQIYAVSTSTFQPEPVKRCLYMHKECEVYASLLFVEMRLAPWSLLELSPRYSLHTASSTSSSRESLCA